MRAIVPRHIFGIDEPQIGFVDQRGCLEAMPSTLSCHAPARDLVKFPLYERNQSAEGGLVALSPFQKQCRWPAWDRQECLSACRPVHRFAAHSRSTGRRLSCMSPGRSASGALVFVGSVALPFGCS